MWLVLFAGFLTGAVAALVLVVRGLMLGVRQGLRSRTGLLRAVASVASGAALGMYAWGMGCLSLPVMDAESGGTDSSPLRPCREAGMDKARHVRDYGVGFLPLRFECETAGGGSYTVPSAVPSYVHASTAAFALVAVAAAAGSAVIRVRREPTDIDEGADAGTGDHQSP